MKAENETNATAQIAMQQLKSGAKEVVVPKVWRSEIPLLIRFAIYCAVCVILSKHFPYSVIEGPLWKTSTGILNLHLPLLWLIPAATLAKGFYRIYNVRFSIDRRGLEARVGRLSLTQQVTRIRFEDIKSIETEQTLMARIFDVGDVELGTAGTGEVEVVFAGISSPKEVQNMIQNERDSRFRLAERGIRLREEALRVND